MEGRAAGSRQSVRAGLVAALMTAVGCRDSAESACASGAESAEDFGWMACLRYYVDKTANDGVDQKGSSIRTDVIVRVANGSLPFGYEFFGNLFTPIWSGVDQSAMHLLHSSTSGMHSLFVVGLMNIFNLIGNS